MKKIPRLFPLLTTLSRNLQFNTLSIAIENRCVVGCPAGLKEAIEDGSVKMSIENGIKMYYFPRRKVGKVETSTKVKTVKQQDESEMSPAELEKF
eukprot:6463427-Amphidinium_carterae.1